MKYIAHKLLVMFVGLLFANVAFADNEIISRSYYLDPTNTMPFEQVEKQAFKAYDNVLTGGFNTGTYWLKLRLRPSDQDVVLRVRPLFTEEIELFDPEANDKKPLLGANTPGMQVSYRVQVIPLSSNPIQWSAMYICE